MNERLPIPLRVGDKITYMTPSGALRTCEVTALGCEDETGFELFDAVMPPFRGGASVWGYVSQVTRNHTLASEASSVS